MSAPHSLRRRLLVAVFALAWAGCGDDGPATPLTETDVPDEVADSAADAGDGDAPDSAPDAEDVDASDAGDTTPTDTEPDAADTADTADAADTPDTPDTPDTADSADTAVDTADDTADIPPDCGNGIVDEGEECDDGNTVNTDSCSNACRIAYCGDGVINATLGIEEVPDLEVTGFGARAGYVCDDGATCAAGASPATCNVADSGNASEHGICQAMGYDRAISVTWGGGPGTGTTPMHHAYNWECVDFVCTESPFASYAADCAGIEMLAALTCEGIIGEECDDGVDNADVADACRTDCTAPECGDGIIDTGEACDDGEDNGLEADACRPDCVRPACGDGIIDTGEACDDGEDNADAADACRTSCALPECTDGIVDRDEECDDGNEVNDDGCSNRCRLPGCRDGVLQAGEECDDGNEVNDDGCSNNCLLPQCGDGVLQGGEECDDGNEVDDDGCSNACVTARCGDSVVQTEGEMCSVFIVYDTTGGLAGIQSRIEEAGFEQTAVENRGGSVAADAAQLREHPFVIFHNYNRSISTAERDGLEQYVQSGGTLLVTGYDSLGSPTDGNLASVLRVSAIGDGPFSSGCTILTEDHPITDGPYGSWAAGTAYNATSTDHDNLRVSGSTLRVVGIADSAKVTIAEGVGPNRGRVMYWNGNSGLNDWLDRGTGEAMFMNILAAYCRGLAEECDDGDDNADVAGASCRTDCRLPRCGDGVHDPALGEECDDGNFVQNDGCSNLCRTPQCGDGVVQSGEECDDGNDSDTDACRDSCRLQVCGDGFLADAEECDDGEANADEPDAGCRTDCRGPRCGDGIVDTGELCDAGASNSMAPNAECRPHCTPPFCGDGVVDTGEVCDDGNYEPGDGCAPDCGIPP